MEVEKPAFLGEEETEVAGRVDFCDLAKRLVGRVVMGKLGAAVELFLEVVQLPLRDPKGLVDGFMQVGMLILPQQVVGLVTDDEVGAAGDAELDVDDRRNGAGQVLGPLVDVNPAGGEPVENSLEVRHALPDFRLCPVRAFEIVEGDFERHLHGVTPDFRRNWRLCC